MNPRHSARLSSLAETIITKDRRTYKTGPPYGRWAAKRIPFYTFEAGMCMKTKDRKTQCPKKIRLLGLNFRHFCNNRRPFCPKMQICDDNLLRQSSFLQVSTGAENLGRRCGAGALRKARTSALRLLGHRGAGKEPQGRRAAAALRSRENPGGQGDSRGPTKGPRFTSMPPELLSDPGGRGCSWSGTGSSRRRCGGIPRFRAALCHGLPRRSRHPGGQGGGFVTLVGVRSR